MKSFQITSTTILAILLMTLYRSDFTFADQSTLIRNRGNQGMLVGTEIPTNAGILRLARGWHLSEYDDVMSLSPGERWNVENLGPISEGVPDFDSLSSAPIAKKLKGDWIMWKAFEAPLDWHGKTVWFTYDTRRLTDTRLSEILLNGIPVPVRLSKPAEGYGNGSWREVTEPPENLTPLFADVGSHLLFDRPNIISFRIDRWPPDRNSGVWMYSTPDKERVLFLLTPDVSGIRRDMVEDYVSYVAHYFDVDPLIETASFRTAEEQRSYLINYYDNHNIAGAVFIGTFPRIAKYTPGLGGGCPRYYEDLDAEFHDTGGARIDKVHIPANYGGEIWTSWIRLIPTKEHLFEWYLQKVLDYYEGRICFPDEPVVLGWKDGVWDRYISPKRGLYCFDALTRPSDFIELCGHGGIGFVHGPKIAVKGKDITERIYPGPLMLRLGGCHTGLIGSTTEQTQLKNSERYLFGRCITQAVSANSRPGIKKMKPNVPGWVEALLETCPHFGIFHCWRTDMWGEHTASYSRTYEESGCILMGNPFVGLHRVPIAPWGSAAGRISTTPNSPRGSAAQTNQIEGFYVSVSQDGNWHGRVRTDANGQYQLDYLLPGKYDIELHLNALESLKNTVTIWVGQQSEVNWQLPKLWSVEGTVFDPDGNPNHVGWVEMAPTSKFKRMRANRYDVFSVCPDEYGRFKLFGSESASFYLRSRIKFKTEVYRSESVNVTIKTGQFLTNVDLWASQL